MGEVTFEVIETCCWPHAWFGGPVHNGVQLDRMPCYYFATEKEARDNVNALRDRALSDELAKEE